MPPQGRPLIDSHIHLYLPSHYESLAWIDPSNPLYSSHDLPVYLSRVSSQLDGCIFVETDRRYTDPSSTSTFPAISNLSAAIGESISDDEAWQHVLAEYKYVSTLARDSDKLVGIVPWAPIHLGAEVLARYKIMLQEVDEEVFGIGADDSEIDKKAREKKGKLIVGYRYLLQDKPLKQYLDERFLDGLRWIKEQGKVFDLGVDVRSGGIEQLEHAVQIVQEVDGGEVGSKKPGLKIVINHLTKPPLGLSTDTELYRKWLSLLETLAAYPSISIKFSGAFSELPELPPSQSEQSPFPIKQVCEIIKPFAKPILRLFGPKRVIWASDWPVCNIGYEKIMKEQVGGWKTWVSVSESLLDSMVNELVEEGCGTIDEWGAVWGENAIRLYSVHKN